MSFSHLSLLLLLAAVAATAASSDQQRDTDATANAEAADESSSAPSQSQQQQQQPQDDAEDGVAGELQAHADVHVQHVFPNQSSTRLQAVLGDSVQLLMLVSSSTADSLNVSHAVCSLHSPLDHSFIIQNFSSKPFGAIVTRDADVSLDFVFRPDAALHPIEYGLEARLSYTVDDVAYASTFFNGTIEMIEAPFEWSADSVAPYAVLGALMLLGAALLVKRGANGRSDAASHRSSRGQKATNASSDWIDAAMLTRPASGARSGSSRRKAAKKH